MNAKQRLLAKATPKQEIKPQTKQTKETVLVEDETIQSSINRIASANIAMKALEGHQKTEKKVIQEYAIDLALDNWIEAGQVTPNPRLQTKSNASVLFQIKDATKKFRIPNKEINGKSEKVEVKTFLEEKEFPKTLIDRLIKESEFTEKDVTTIPLPQIEEKNPQLYDKIFELIEMASEGGVRSIKNNRKTLEFTQEEIGQMLINSNEISVKEDFMDRMPSHALKAAKDKKEAKTYLKLLFDTFPPQPAVSHANVGNNHELILKSMLGLLSKEELTKVENSEIQEVVKDKPRKENHETADFKLQVEGLNIKIFRKSDKVQVCIKECEDISHVDNTIKFVEKESRKLGEFYRQEYKVCVVRCRMW